MLTRYEGIIPALESSHALAHALKLAEGSTEEKIYLVNLSGRGDKDLTYVRRLLGDAADEDPVQHHVDAPNVAGAIADLEAELEAEQG